MIRSLARLGSLSRRTSLVAATLGASMLPCACSEDSGARNDASSLMPSTSASDTTVAPSPTGSAPSTSPSPNTPTPGSNPLPVPTPEGVAGAGPDATPSTPSPTGAGGTGGNINPEPSNGGAPAVGGGPSQGGAGGGGMGPGGGGMAPGGTPTNGGGGSMGVPGGSGGDSSGGGSPNAGVFTLTSPGWEGSNDEGCTADAETTCPRFPQENVAATIGGDNESPELNWVGAPQGTQSFALVLQDLVNDNVHWVLYDIPAETTGLPSGLPTNSPLDDPPGAKQGAFFNNVGYFGSGACGNTYEFRLYALSVATLPEAETDSNDAVNDWLNQASEVLAEAFTRVRSGEPYCTP